VVGPLQTNCYIVICEETKEAIIIDPGDEAPRVSAVVNYHGANVKCVVATHGHFDHVMAVGELKERYSVPFMAGRQEKD
ncbi:MAG: MBL fold metallo-hydrolase, partial [Armatimonadetes bacterium]|nr:MBL fold metallo-hydrolase [Armatimonadota bacterium]